MTKDEQQADALARARNGFTMSNYPAIFAGFEAKGIPFDQIKPRENVFTYNAWKALGRHVRKGEHGVHVLTFITCKAKQPGQADPDTDPRENPQPKHYRRPRNVTVFHISQTDPDTPGQTERSATE